MKRTRRRFTAEFKQEAVRLVHLGPLTFNSATYVGFEIVVTPEPGTAVLTALGLLIAMGVTFRSRPKRIEQSVQVAGKRTQTEKRPPSFLWALFVILQSSIAA